MKYLDCFAGIGGFSLGIKQAYESICNANGSSHGGGEGNPEGNKTPGFQPEERESSNAEKGSTCASSNSSPVERPLCIGFSEIDKYASQIYQQHFPSHKAYGDITRIDTDTLPDFDLLCGGFPCQAFSIAGKRRGFEDTRGTLFFELARILKAKQPRYFIFENVKGLLSHDNGNTFKTIISTLAELGYDLEWQVLNSKNFGVPQNRERVFIVGHLRGTSGRQIFPITGCARNNINSSIIGGTLTSRYPASQREGAYIEEARHDGAKIRKLTPKECERLQGFPDNWTKELSDTQRYKCLGNAVTVNVIEYLMSRILIT